MNAAFGCALLGFAAGCVPRSQYVDSLDALTAERAYRQTVEARVGGLEHEVARVNAALAGAEAARHEQKQALEALGKERDQAAFEITVAQKAREDAAQLVDQLREELARVGSHLRAFSDQKQALGEALKVADAKAAQLQQLEATARERALLLRDLALALHEPVSSGEVELSIEDGEAVLKVPLRYLFKEKELAPSASGILGAVARVVGIHKGSRLQVIEVGGPNGAQHRVEQVVTKLKSQGVASNQLVPGTAPKASVLPGEEHVEFRVGAAGV